VVPIRTPPLRERTQDIPALATHFAQLASGALGVRTPEITLEALEHLKQRPWAGNIRELANAVERAVILTRHGPLTPQSFDSRTALPARPAPAPGSDPASETSPYGDIVNLKDLERIAIERALQVSGGRRARAAELLGISERTLRNKLNS
jgi:DNA-binding NtrC family response regulator